MIVAIVGANGFIGTRLVEMFHLGGRHTVVPIVRRASGLALAARFAVDWRIGDAINVTSLAAALRGCDAVVHTALGDTRQIEAMPTTLCAAAGIAGVRRVIYLSSASVHGQAPQPGTTEDSPLHCRHAMDYNNAKVRAERAFFRGCTRHGLAGFALRPGVVFGPRSRWIADLAADLRNERAWLLGDGDGICNTLYVDNLVEAVAQCLTAPADATGPYLVGDTERVTWSGFYHSVATALGIAPSGIHRLAAVPALRRTTQEQISRLVAGRTVQTVLPVVPARWKTVAKRLTAALAPAAASPDSWRLTEKPRPRISQELALLQQCRWQLPSNRAALRLGYRPVVSFTTAMRRSVAWLAFAEGSA
ncbi:MAG: NAD-dependent epimerase/dehydratase family protein [Undibacterium sp.]|nr:NAD-dependent epimerase/dehydratase family protein [Opitutaceae bacterium]